MNSWYSNLIDKFIPQSLAESIGLGVSAFSLGRSNFRLRTKQKMFDAYEFNPLVFQVIDRQSTVVSSLPYIFVGAQGDVVENTREQSVFDKPNAETTGKEFRYSLITDLLVSGEAFFYRLKPVGSSRTTELHNMPSQLTKVYTNADGIYQIDTKIFGESRTIKGEDLANVTRVMFKSPKGGSVEMSKLSTLGEVISASSSILETEAYIFKNRGASKLLTNDSDMPMTPAEQKELNESFQRATAGEHNAGKAHLTNAKLRAIDLLQSPAELKLDDSSMSKLRIIAGVFGLDSKIFGDPTASTYNNMSEAQTSAYNQVFLPLAEDYIVQVLNLSWLEADGSTVRVAINYDDIDAIKTADKAFAEVEEIRMRTVDAVMKMQISSEGRETLLINELGYSPESARDIVNASGASGSLETLKTLPALLASKMIERMTDEEIRKLLGL